MELLEKHWVKIPVILYVFGFIVHNVYLSYFGSHEFELVQAKYILSGFGMIGFSVICCVYIGIKVNLSNINKNLTIDNLLPWVLRIISLPYALYTLLYDEKLSTISQDQGDPFIIFIILASALAHCVVGLSVLNITLLIGKKGTLLGWAKTYFMRIFSIPMTFVTLIVALENQEFAGILKVSTLFFFLYLGAAMYQGDRSSGVEILYTDPETKEKYEDFYQIVFGIISIFIILWVVVSNYTKYVYPKIPVALGGAKIEFVSMTVKGNTFESYIIQETKDWIMYINKESGQVEKTKTNLIEKIVFKREVKDSYLIK